MASKIVECVPNFSEGRDKAKIRRIADAIEAVPGVKLLDVDSGHDPHRTVMTFLGDPDAIAKAAYEAIAMAARVIDMREHRGTHPRLGATDVCPFVPVQGVTLDDCVHIAHEVGRRVGDELQIPVYFYEAASRRSGRTNLADVRRGEYEGLVAKLRDPKWRPDCGPNHFNPRTGATIIGARDFLIAYNITLNTRDKAAASDIAHELRERGRYARTPTDSPFYADGKILVYREHHYPCGNCGFVGATWEETEHHCLAAHNYDLRRLAAETIPGFPEVLGKHVRRAGLFKFCKAIGWYAEEFGRAQISTNLTNYRETPPHRVLEKARELAAERGLTVTGSEVIGLIPVEALAQAGRFYLTRQGRSPDVPMREILQAAVHAMGLDDLRPFDIARKTIGSPC